MWIGVDWDEEDEAFLHISEKLQQGPPAKTILLWILTIFCCSLNKICPLWQKLDQRSSWKSCHLMFLSSATSKTQIYFPHINILMMFLTTIMMMTMTSAMMIVTKYSLPTINFATRYSTRYSDFLLQPYSKPTRSKKSLLAGTCFWAVLRAASGLLKNTDTPKFL